MTDRTQLPRAWLLRSNAVLAVILAATVSQFAQAYELIDLGVDVSPTDINNGGIIVGSRKTDSGNVGFILAPGGSVGDIPGTTVANAINNLNQVTGRTLTGAFLYDGSLREWDGYGGYGINELSQISGNKELTNPYRATPLPLDPAIYTPNKWDNLGVAQTYPRGTRKGVYADLYVLDDMSCPALAMTCIYITLS